MSTSPYDSMQLCLCEMCKCGNHGCPPNEAEHFLKNRGTKELFEEKNTTKQNAQRIESDRYSSSIYKQDFQIGHNIAGVAEPSKLVPTLKCETGPMVNDSIYSKDFIPWSVEDMELCRSVLSKDSKQVFGDPRMKKKESFGISDLYPEDVERLREYYCPPHCLGLVETPKIRNCLAEFKDKFNLGPPQKRAPSSKKPLRPISKFTNYLLDYIPHKIEPRQAPTKKQVPNQHTTPLGISTHKNDYVPWPAGGCDLSKLQHTSGETKTKTTKELGNKESSENTWGGGPMATQSNYGMDYRDPNVTGGVPRRQREVFTPPTCGMETQTTAGASYPRWRELPPKVKYSLSKETNLKPSSNETECFVTIYQQDYDDLREVLCPAKIIEKYGRKFLEPKCRYIGTDDEHEYYRCRKKQI